MRASVAIARSVGCTPRAAAARGKVSGPAPMPGRDAPISIRASKYGAALRVGCCCECEAQRHLPARREATVVPAAAVHQSASMSPPITFSPSPRPGRSRNISPAGPTPRVAVCPVPHNARSHARSRSSRSRPSRPATTEGPSKPFPPSKMPAPLLSTAEYDSMPEAVRLVLPHLAPADCSRSASCRFA